MCPGCGISPTLEKGVNAIAAVILIMAALVALIVIDLWLGDRVTLPILVATVGWLLYKGVQRLRRAVVRHTPHRL